jgi:PAS domain S-box-containing protein
VNLPLKKLLETHTSGRHESGRNEPGRKESGRNDKPVPQERADTLNSDFDILQRELLENGDPIGLYDRHGLVVYTNAAFDRIAEAFTANAPLNSFGSDRNYTANDELTSLKSLAGSVINEYAVRINGRTEYYRAKHRAINGNDGEFVGSALILTPLSEVKALNAALSLANERLDDTTRLVSDWIWETDRNLQITYISPQVQKTLGFHPSELIGRSLSALPSAANEELETRTAPDHRRPFRDLNVEIKDRSGTAHNFLLNGLPVYDHQNGNFAGFRGSASDITETRNRQLALFEAKEAAELANRVKSEFLANMSHELRTPLNAIIGFSEMMSSELLGPLGNEQYQGYSHDILVSAQHLLGVINDILDVAKIEAGKLHLTEEDVNPHEVLGTVKRLMSERAERVGINLKLDAAKDLPHVWADARKLKQILINLMANSVKFTPGGGRIELSAFVDQRGDFVFAVTDTGIGIAKEDIDKALAPFTQIDSQLSRQFEGTGLGLPLAKGFTELHDGELKLVSEPGKGTQVTIHLPARRVIPN